MTSQDSDRNRFLPPATTRVGVLVYTVAGGLVVATLLALLHHIRIVWS